MAATGMLLRQLIFSFSSSATFSLLLFLAGISLHFFLLLQVPWEGKKVAQNRKWKDGSDSERGPNSRQTLCCVKDEKERKVQKNCIFGIKREKTLLCNLLGGSKRDGEWDNLEKYPLSR